MSAAEPQDPRLDAALEKLASARDASDEGPQSAERLGDTRAAVAADGGLLTGMRSLPTPVRVSFAGLALGALAGVVLLFNARPDLWAYPTTRLVIEAGLAALLSLALSAVALRGPHRAMPGAWVTWGLVAVALAVPLALALAPPADLMLPGAKGEEGAFSRDAFACFVYGVGAALPVMGVLALLQRLPPTGARIAALAAGGAGLGGVLALQMHCPIAMRDHLLLGHAFVPLFVLLAVLLVRRALGGPSS